MIFIKILITASCFFLLFIANAASAQSTITFQINLKPQIEDSIFIPGRDVAEITGNISPLYPSRAMQLEDTAPVDSIYSVEIRFPHSALDKKLTYRYALKLESRTLEESMPRVITISRGKHELSALYFDSYAW